MSKRSESGKRTQATAARRRAKGDPRAARAMAAAEPLPRGWAPFARRLAGVLAGMEDNTFLILTVAGRHRFVQFAGDADGRLVAECVGDHFLEDDQQLTAGEKRALARIGWQKPLRPKVPDDSTRGNWWLKLRRPADTARAVEVAVRTFSEAYGVRGPASLRYNSFEAAGTSLDQAALGIEREAEAEPTTAPGMSADDRDDELSPLAREVAEALAPCVPKLEVAPRNRFRCERDGVAMQAVVLQELPLMRIMSDVGSVSPELEATMAVHINHLNSQHLDFGYLYLRDGMVRYAAETVLVEDAGGAAVWLLAFAVEVVVQLREGGLGLAKGRGKRASARKARRGVKRKAR